MCFPTFASGLVTFSSDLLCMNMLYVRLLVLILSLKKKQYNQNYNYRKHDVVLCIDLATP